MQEYEKHKEEIEKMIEEFNNATDEELAYYEGSSFKNVNNNINRLKNTPPRMATEHLFDHNCTKLEIIYDATPATTLSGQTYNQTPSADFSELTSNFISNILDLIKEKGLLRASTINKYMGDPNLVSKYIAAIGYGGYNMRDIYRDLKAKELVDMGNATYSNVKAFDETMPASQWYNTEEYRSA